MGSAEGTETRLELDEAQGWSGHRLDDMGGANVGKIEGVLVDADGRRPEWLLARMGRFGHHTVIPARDAVEGVGHVWVPYGRDLIRRAPKVESGGSLNVKAEREMLEHYGIAADAGRFAELAERDPEAISAEPA